MEERENKFYINISYKEEMKQIETSFIPDIHPLDDVELPKRIENLEKINKDIIGQPEMVESIKEAVISHYSKKEKGQAISIALIGSTGTGKTEMGKALARTWFGHESRFSVISLGGINTRDSSMRFSGPHPATSGLIKSTLLKKLCAIMPVGESLF